MTPHTKKLTVAILTYNRRDYLREVLESLAWQTFKDFSVIIFDNASDYDVQGLADEFPAMDITVDANETNLGNIANFRKMISHPFASQYVIMFHDDDTIHPEYFKQAIAFLDTHPQAVLAGSNIKFITNSTPEKMTHFSQSVTSHPFKEMNQQELIHKLLDGFSLGFGSVIYRSEAVWTAVERYDEFHKWLDRPYLLDIIGDLTAGITEGKFINYRIHGGQDSQFVEPLRLNNVISLFKYYREKNGEYKLERYKTLEANNAINTAHHVAGTFADFFSIITRFKDEGMYKVSSVGWKGVYYFCKFVLKRLRLLFRA